MRIFESLQANCRGATAIDYALTASLISVAGITAYHGLGDKVEGGFSNDSGNINSAI